MCFLLYKNGHPGVSFQPSNLLLVRLGDLASNDHLTVVSKDKGRGGNLPVILDSDHDQVHRSRGYRMVLRTVQSGLIVTLR